jgi:ABC-type multidrug transport system ATPase subunit
MRPLLEVVRVRVDVGGVPQVDGLSFTTTGERVLVLAAPRALFEAAAALTGVRHGELLVSGVLPRVAVSRGLVASAPLGLPLPPSWSALEYVTWSARLAGHRAQDSDDLARRSLRDLKLDAIAGVRLRLVPLAARRALGVAAAVATGAATLLLEDPLRDLPDDAARSLARTVVRATEGLRTVIFAPRSSLASPLSIDADEVIVLGANSVMAQGAPAEVAARDRTYSLRVHGRGASFAQLAEARGARVSGRGSLWTVDLGSSPLAPTDILDMAAASDTVVLDLRPLSYSFA